MLVRLDEVGVDTVISTHGDLTGNDFPVEGLIILFVLIEFEHVPLPLSLLAGQREFEKDTLPTLDLEGSPEEGVHDVTDGVLGEVPNQSSTVHPDRHLVVGVEVGFD